MPKRNDGNEQDLRVRPSLDAKRLDTDNPYSDSGSCEEHGTQVDLPEAPPCGTITATTPDGSIDYDWRGLNRVCPDGFSARTLDQFFMALLKNHFSSSSRICKSNLQGLVYTDSSDSAIAIQMNTNWDSTTYGSIPSIVVKRGQQKPMRITIGDRGSFSESVYDRSRYVRMMQGVHSIMCIGGQDGVTEDLGLEVFDLFTCLSPVFREELPFHDFQTVILSELGIMEDTGAKLAVVVQCAYAYEYAWTLTRNAPELSSVLVDLDVKLQ